MHTPGNEMKRAYQAKGVSIDIRDIDKLDKLSNAIVRAIPPRKPRKSFEPEACAPAPPRIR